VRDDIDDEFIGKHVFYIGLVSFPIVGKAFSVASAVFGRVDKMANLGFMSVPWIACLPGATLQEDAASLWTFSQLLPADHLCVVYRPAAALQRPSRICYCDFHSGYRGCMVQARRMAAEETQQTWWIRIYDVTGDVML
jgi:hypothetical protein